MFLKIMISLFSLTISFSAAAEKMPKRPPNASPAQCLDLAIKTAKTLDTLTERGDAKDDVTTISEVEFIDADISYSKFLTYNFGNGESYLEVIIEADRYAKGECMFRSATIMLQE